MTVAHMVSAPRNTKGRSNSGANSGQMFEQVKSGVVGASDGGLDGTGLDVGCWERLIAVGVGRVVGSIMKVGEGNDVGTNVGKGVIVGL